jgi:IS6 family transposase
MKTDGGLWRRSRLRQVKYLNKFVEQDHRRIKRLICPGAWLWRLLDGTTNTGGLRGDGDDQEGEVRNIGGRDIRAQAAFIAELF